MTPWANIFVPSLLGIGEFQWIGPEVNRTGSVGARRNSPRRSSRTHSWLAGRTLLKSKKAPRDRNTKNFPSGVQRPQHCGDEGCQPGSNGWSPDPSDDTSQSRLSLEIRILLPSGDQLSGPGKPPTAASLRVPAPSLRVI